MAVCLAHARPHPHREVYTRKLSRPPVSVISIRSVHRFNLRARVQRIGVAVWMFEVSFQVRVKGST